MRSVSTGSISAYPSAPDCRDEETYRLLNAFFQIQDPHVRTQVTKVVAAILDDEDWAGEILELTEHALTVSDDDLNEQIRFEPF